MAAWAVAVCKELDVRRCEWGSLKRPHWLTRDLGTGVDHDGEDPADGEREEWVGV
jgi:hypothetical protein